MLRIRRNSLFLLITVANSDSPAVAHLFERSRRVHQRGDASCCYLAVGNLGDVAVGIATLTDEPCAPPRKHHRFRH